MFIITEHLSAILKEAANKLQKFLLSGDFTTHLHFIFGEVDLDRAYYLIEDLSNNLRIFSEDSAKNSNYSLDLIDTSLNIEFLSQDIVEESTGAFANNTIYLSEYFTDRERLLTVFLKELGHFVDFQLNAGNAKEDEGNLFALIVLNQELTREELAIIKSEDDSDSLTLEDGTTIQVEQLSTSNLPHFSRADCLEATSLEGIGEVIIKVINL